MLAPSASRRTSREVNRSITSIASPRPNAVEATRRPTRTAAQVLHASRSQFMVEGAELEVEVEVVFSPEAAGEAVAEEPIEEMIKLVVRRNVM